MKYLIFSHGHPNYSKGGAEIAAHRLFQGINQIPGHSAWFVARCPDNMLHLGSPIAAINERELLISGNADIPNLTATIRLGSDSDFAEMLRHINPDVVHFHHYINFGVEMLHAVRRELPNAKILLTLHEFIAICSNNGQMYKTNNQLCHSYSPRDCSQCFPDRNPEDFFLREQYIKSFFANVDMFISPSHFLMERYISWGIPREKITVIENGQMSEPPLAPRPIKDDDSRNVFGFFGQINPYKGVDVLLQAVANLSKKERRKLVLEIHGANLEYQTPAFQEKINALLKPLQKEGVVRVVGPYQPHEMRDRMANIDWVVVPSIWWENSPMVIQEALLYGRPLLVSNIGGMAEKVQHQITGLHVPANNTNAWGNTLLHCAKNSQLWQQLTDNIRQPLSITDCAREHLALISGK
jgi:glycosyltransferase involved in cell wall biosynthesis